MLRIIGDEIEAYWIEPDGSEIYLSLDMIMHTIDSEKTLGKFPDACRAVFKMQQQHLKAAPAKVAS